MNMLVTTKHIPNVGAPLKGIAWSHTLGSGIERARARLPSNNIERPSNESSLIERDHTQRKISRPLKEFTHPSNDRKTTGTHVLIEDIRRVETAISYTATFMLHPFGLRMESTQKSLHARAALRPFAALQDREICSDYN